MATDTAAKAKPEIAPATTVITCHTVGCAETIAITGERPIRAAWADGWRVVDIDGILRWTCPAHAPAVSWPEETYANALELWDVERRERAKARAVAREQTGASHG